MAYILQRTGTAALLAALLAFLVIPGLFGPTSVAAGLEREPESNAAVMRVGTFVRKDLLIAYYCSEVHTAHVKELQADRDRALAAGEKERAAELEAQEAAEQEHARRQLAGEATLTNILPHLEKAWTQIASEERLDLIVEQPLFRREAVEEVDITAVLAAKFPAAAKKGGKKKNTKESGGR
ncbi:MAG: hypothetical protein GY711_02095 [bacterium]|nr:hypothetical protein [bacterium]